MGWIKNLFSEDVDEKKKKEVTRLVKSERITTYKDGRIDKDLLYDRKLELLELIDSKTSFIFWFLIAGGIIFIIFIINII